MEEIRTITFAKKNDIRGALVPIESYKDVPFNIERIFFIKDMDKFPRGFHAHKKTIQVLVPVSGSLDIELTDGCTIYKSTLERDDQGLLIPRAVWLQMSNFSEDCIILVICSYEYDEREYIRNFGDFIEYRHNLPKNMIKCFDPTLQNQLLKSEIHRAITTVLDGNRFVLGPELESFERNFAQYNGSKFCVGVSNGTSAMVCALKALGLDAGDEVIIQSNAYIAAPLAINACNLEIKIVDIDDGLFMDLDRLETSITEKTRAVLVVHLYGRCPDMHKLLHLKEKYGFRLIEDCAQAHGSTFEGRKLGTFGEMGCFSFYPSKNLGSFGEGGCVITDTPEYYEYIRKYRNYGSKERYVWEIKGANEKMQNLQAAILDVKLKYLDSWNQKRRELAKIYNRELADIPGITLLRQDHRVQCNYHLYVILVDDRDKLQRKLLEHGIQTAIHYPETFYQSAAFESLNGLNFKADSIKKRLLSLPMYPELSEENVLQVCEKVKAILLLI